MDKVLSSRTVREFDSLFTSPQFGYKDVKEYYTDACIALKVQNIKVPVLALNAEDDPFQVRLKTQYMVIQASAVLCALLLIPPFKNVS